MTRGRKVLNCLDTLGQRLGLILWKNLLLRRRHWFVTAFEIILPTLIAIGIAWIRTLIVDHYPVVNLQDTIYSVDTEKVS
jgi:hypothetical protein